MIVASLNHLSLLNFILDALLLKSPLLCIPPPNRTLILATHTEIDTGATGRVVLIALLSTQTTCKAAYSNVC